jgi:hypothetical protein
LSRFNTDNFCQLLKEYQTSAGGDLLKVEKTLRHVGIPDLDERAGKTPGESNITQDHEEVKILTDWLKSRYHVNKIYSLEVLDREKEPHDEDIIAQICNEFRVEKLHWRRLDMSAKMGWWGYRGYPHPLLPYIVLELTLIIA